ncbi:MAG: CinA family protein [Candidatus Sericytochromatia bacterium]
MTLESRMESLQPGLARLHASPWIGLIEEVGTGSWIQAMVQSAPGASATLWAGRTSYAREVQEQLYGPQARSVSREAVEAWARANLSVAAKRFSLAVSGAVASDLNRGDAHAWLALTLSDGRGWTLHLRCREKGRLAQQLSLGELGTLLLIQLADTEGPELPELAPVRTGSIEIDACESWQASPSDSCLEAVRLVQSGATPLALLQPAAGRLRAVRYLDLLRGRRLLLHKGSFNPVTSAHLQMVEQVLAQDPDYLPILEISLHNADKGKAEELNLVHRLTMLGLASPWPVALTRTPALYQTRELFQDHGRAAAIDFICGEDLFRRVFLERYYQDLDGGIGAGLERLFSSGSRLWVCGRETQLDFPPQAQALAQAYASQIRHLPLDLPVASSTVRTAIAAGEPGWQDQLPQKVVDYIEQAGIYRAEVGL